MYVKHKAVKLSQCLGVCHRKGVGDLATVNGATENKILGIK